MNEKRSGLPDVLRRAAHIIQRNGHHQGDYVPDPFNKVLTSPRETRPMSVDAALYCAASPDGRMVESEMACEAIRFLAGRVLVDGEGPWDAARTLDCQIHMSAWGDVEGRTAGEVVRLLLDAADDASQHVVQPSSVVLGREVAA